VGASLIVAGEQGKPRGFSVTGALARYAADHHLTVAAGRWFTDRDKAVEVRSARAGAAVNGIPANAAAALGRELRLNEIRTG
jgi:hypothetical protein